LRADSQSLRDPDVQHMSAASIVEFAIHVDRDWTVSATAVRHGLQAGTGHLARRLQIRRQGRGT